MSAFAIGPFQSYAAATRPVIERALEQYTAYEDDCPAILRDAIRHSLLGGGKRLRPLLVLMSAEACGSTMLAAMPAACAVEMVHSYSLIHDDLPAMDNDDWRRGRPSCHKMFGEALAILAGDALLTQAFEVLSSFVRPPDVAAKCCQELAAAAGPRGMVGGQVDDLQAAREEAELEQEPAADSSQGPEHRFSQDTSDRYAAREVLARLERIHRRKTGALFRAALRMGGIIAGADSSDLAALGQYAEKLGLAFQVVDDLLDIRGDPHALGKSVGKDARQQKLTFPAVLGIEESQRRAVDLIHQAQSAVRKFGSKAECLVSLASYIVERSR